MGDMPKMPPTHDPKGRTPEERMRERKRHYDKRRAGVNLWRSWYNTPRWRALRAWVLRRDPSCRLCLFEGRVTIATVCDHVREHKGEEVLFWDRGNLWGLCGTCHNSVKQRMERALVKRSKETVQGVHEYLAKVYSATVGYEQQDDP